MADLSRPTSLLQLGRSQGFTDSARSARERDRFSVAIDAVCVIGSAACACAFVLHPTGAGLWRAIALRPDHLWIPAVLVMGYAFSIVLNCERFNLYTPERYTSILQEQRHVLQASLTSGLLLIATLYLLHPKDPRTGIVVTTVVLTAIVLSSRRLAARILLHNSLADGAGARNVFIVGTGPTAQAFRSHLEGMRHLGYLFKGFIGVPGVTPDESSQSGVVGSLDSLFDHVRRHFVDEIFFATACDRSQVQNALEQAPYHDVNIHLVPDLFESSILNPLIEHIGEFPTIPLYRRRMPESRLFLKRAVDILISTLTLVLLFPVFLVIAVLIRRDSPGPVFYISERLGKKGHVFRCIKFRTMVQNAESLRSALDSKNQRDGILFKAVDDPRITRIGRFLRKYSIDELPQFMNVLLGEMSIVGPRPPLAGEVKQYRPGHLRRLDVTPGITGLWQVQARKDPSFDRYVSLDMSYIENWSIRLDFEIMLRTIGVVIAGTGS
jgi:exopolysaccharide biosynthesis polyprenyl glycosylphosphotransferase